MQINACRIVEEVKHQINDTFYYVVFVLWKKKRKEKLLYCEPGKII